jgi:tetratricopeptide (TPR) repeat protein
MAVACDLAIQVAVSTQPSALRVEGATDIADLEIWVDGCLDRVVQVKSRAEHRLIGVEDLAELIRRFGAVRAERYELVTDTGIGKGARESILEPAALLAAGEPLEETNLEVLGRLGLADSLRLLSLFSAHPRYGDPQFLLDRALVGAHQALGDVAVGSDGVRQSVERLFVALCVSGGGRLADRTIQAEEIRELLGVGVPRVKLSTDGSRRPLHRLPPRDPRLIPRQAVHEQIQAHFGTGDGEGLAALIGLPGCGKTELAIEVAHDLKPGYRLVWWLEAEHAASVAEGLRQMLSALEISGAQEADDREALAMARDVLLDQAPWMLVLDNVPTPSLLRELGLGSGGDLLVTSRHPAWSGWGQAFDVPPFSESEAVDLLLRHARDGDPAEAARLAGDLGCLPLAVAQAAAYIELSGRSLAEFRSLLAARMDVLGSERAAAEAEGRYERSVLAMLAVLLDQLDDDASLAASAIAHLGAEPVPRLLLAEVGRHGSEQLRDLVNDDLSLDLALAALNSAAVVRIELTGPVMHRLTARAVRHLLPGGETMALAALAALEELFPGDALQTSTWPLGAALLPHARAVLQSSELRSTEQGGWLAVRVCALDHIQGRFREAKALALKGIEVRPKGQEVLRAHLLHAWGRTGLKSGNLSDAVDPLTEALAVLVRLDRTETLDYAAIETTLGAVLSELGVPEAASHLEHALEVQRRELPANDKRIARTLLELAGHLSAKGEHLGAERLERQALEIVDRPDADADIDLARGLGNLAGTLSDIPERREEAMEVALRALDVTRQVYGPEHPEVAYPLTSLGSLLIDEDPQRAYEYLLEALRLRLAGLGPHHEQVGYTLEHLGCVLAETDQPERALTWLQQAHELLRDVFDEDHVEVATAAFDLGRVQAQLDMYDAASPLVAAAIEVLVRAWGQHHPDVSRARELLAEIEKARTATSRDKGDQDDVATRDRA